ncbi:hypothetical protein [Micromonospora sp. NPDC005174]|uniref:hypothetical protein n=1 Tax=Micromonospora sp. NPDC005174 TaxID=3157018 RepID=UPI0033B0065E
MSPDPRPARRSFDELRQTVKVVKPVDFQDRYREYLEASDEKPVLAAGLAPLLRRGSLLDIGAGSGDVPDLLDVDQETYTAVECQPEFVRLLRDKGYRVIDDLFPCQVGGPFTNVLLCYCLYGREQCELLIHAGWAAVAPSGQLLAVTFRDHLDEYNSLLHRVGHTNRGGLDVHYNFLTTTFASLGVLTTHVWTSYIYSRDLAELAGIVSFMATNSNVGTLQRRAEIYAGIMAERRYVDERFRTVAGDYRLPVHHHVFVVAKDVS